MSREDKLRRLREIKNIEIPALEAEYEDLRDALIPEVDEDGIVYIVGPDNKKYRVSVQRQNMLVFDMDVLEAELDEDVLEEVTERKVDRKKFEQAAGAGRVPAYVLTKAVKERPKQPFLHYELDAKQS